MLIHRLSMPMVLVCSERFLQQQLVGLV